MGQPHLLPVPDEALHHGARGFPHGGISGAEVVGVPTGFFAAAGSIVMLGLSLWFLVVMLRTFRKRGYITRYT